MYCLKNLDYSSLLIKQDCNVAPCRPTVVQNNFKRFMKCEKRQSWATVAIESPLYLCCLCVLTDVNECSPNPCNNGGSCVNDYGRYFCQCRRGYAGYNCDRSKLQSTPIVFIHCVSKNMTLDLGNFGPIVELLSLTDLQRTCPCFFEKLLFLPKCLCYFNLWCSKIQNYRYYGLD